MTLVKYWMRTWKSSHLHFTIYIIPHLWSICKYCFKFKSFFVIFWKIINSECKWDKTIDNFLSSYSRRSKISIDLTPKCFYIQVDQRNPKNLPSKYMNIKVDKREVKINLKKIRIWGISVDYCEDCRKLVHVALGPVFWVSFA